LARNVKRSKKEHEVKYVAVPMPMHGMDMHGMEAWDGGNGDEIYIKLICAPF